MLTDPWFWATAVPAVLIVGISKSGFGAGFGALGVPLMALTMPVPKAAAIMLPLLAMMDAMGLAALVRQRDRVLLRRLLPAGLAGTLVGALLFRLMSPRLVAAILGSVTLGFLAIRVFFPAKADAPPPPPWVGRLLAMVSGFTSFVAHAGGPPISFYVLPLRLEPIRLTATLAVFFAVINAAKWLPYAWLGLFDLQNLFASLVLAPFTPIGVWIGVRIVRRIDPKLFYRIFVVGMLLTGTKLLWDGLR
jgi:uncharacterized membrane protein YfcA